MLLELEVAEAAANLKATALPSITIELVDASEPALVKPGRVRIAALPGASATEPPFSSRAVVLE